MLAWVYWPIVAVLVLLGLAELAEASAFAAVAAGLFVVFASSAMPWRRDPRDGRRYP